MSDLRLMSYFDWNVRLILDSLTKLFCGLLGLSWYLFGLYGSILSSITSFSIISYPFLFIIPNVSLDTCLYLLNISFLSKLLFSVVSTIKIWLVFSTGKIIPFYSLKIFNIVFTFTGVNFSLSDTHWVWITYYFV